MIEDRNQHPDKEAHGMRYGERAGNFLSGWATLPTSPCVHQQGISLNPILLGFYEDFIA